jgi:ribonucleoside-diphosphate reductase alpha chain
MIEKGFPHEPDHTKPQHTCIFYFPVKSPDKCITRTERTAIEQMELWMIYKDHYCDHNPSTTINIKENEWPGAGAWVFDNFDKISGIAFLPFSEHSYKQAPYEECNKEFYEEAKKNMPKDVDWSGLDDFEDTDNTTGTQELACTANGCEF